MIKFEYEDEPKGYRPKFNKERFCKRNKLSSGRYGPHDYADGSCKRCGKVDPAKKRRMYE